MLIFYVQPIQYYIYPIVIIDAMSSDDRFSQTDIMTAVYNNVPSGTDIFNIEDVSIFSSEYSMDFEHIGIPLETSLKTRFSATLKSPPALLVSTFSPSFLNSAQSIEQLSDILSTIPNNQNNIVNAAMVVQGSAGNQISRQFIIYAAHLYPDSYGTTTTMILAGAMIDDLIIKSSVAVQIDKLTPLSDQLDIFLASQKPALIGNYDNAPQANELPATEKLFPPMKLYDLLSEICLQNKMLFVMDGLKVKFYGQGQSSAPTVLDYTPPEFSFLGSSGYLAWGLGIENYTNIKFKSSIFDCKLLTKITIYNDIESKVFTGLTKNPSIITTDSFLPITNPDSYDVWIIRYNIRWNRSESICEVTASNNWLMAQNRVDGILESAIYSNAGG